MTAMHLAWAMYRQNYSTTTAEDGFYKTGFIRCLANAHQYMKVRAIEITERQRKEISQGA